ncbi:ATP phosphoribosyltransferase [Candidatus Tremblaya phenacola]|uniref:ATP phosphoribosyltransferase n=1 Tax=Candidatus Tremblayella phenacoccinincola TaxID=1010676 RepID=A0A2G0V740_9PROT|nr:ATP phosphoribosyltransferase [Candidatus Tremblaya phenacola]PHN16232.1 ATP phosphoribosyltransferase [Candidatus Tremblaya phenacola]PHN16295.1 ATP phosphoribosyltransferase [Candidatus Tremblaya phenacola]
MNYLTLTIALQRSGRLSNKSTYLVSYYKTKQAYNIRKLILSSNHKAVRIMFVRDDDIPNLILTKTVDLGIIGKNVFEEQSFRFIIYRKLVNYYIIYSLKFSSCRLSLAFPLGEPWTGISCLDGKKVATSYPYILKHYLKRYSISYILYYITGSVEVAYSSGLSDIIFDVVSTGSTLFVNGLYEAKIVYYSHAYLIQCLPKISNNKLLLVNRFKNSIYNIKRPKAYIFISSWFIYRKLVKIIQRYIKANVYNIASLNNKSIWVLFQLYR